MMELKRDVEDANHTVYLTGFPWLYTSVLRYVPEVREVFVVTLAALCFLLWNYFRTWTGIWVPVLSGLLSSVWALGMGPLLGLNMDPLVLVVPIFLSARALSHSVQSMDRYHEEYHRLGDKHEAIVQSYSHLFPPAIASVLSDGIGILLVAIAPIPLIQKIAVFSSFWIVSIIVSVVTLHPIILSVINPPGVRQSGYPRWSRWAGHGTLLLGGALFAVYALEIGYRLLGGPKLGGMLAIAAVLYLFHEQIYGTVTRVTIAASAGWRRWAVALLSIALYILCPIWGWRLKVGDMTPGAALLFPHHPYNVAYAKLNEKFLGANQLVVIADTGREDGMKDVAPLTTMEEFADHMEAAPGAGASVTVIDIVKQLARLYHEGEPKWGFVPDKQKYIAELFYTFTQTGQAGDLDRFLSTDMRYGTIITLFHGYSHDIIMNAIDTGKRWAAEHAGEHVQFLFAGGLFGVLAAVNEAVESSYWMTLALVMVAVAACLYLTYGSLVAVGILMIPVVLSQLACEAFMYLWQIDLNVNSLPIAAAGAGVGVDYGIYHFSRMIDAFDEGRTLDEAVDYATATTGKAIVFTATTMVASTIFWWFSDLKFQAEMGLLLALLMLFNTFGGLVIVPGMKDVGGRRARRAAVEDALGRAALAEVAARRIGTLSKGARQRLGLALALVGDPPALLLDEPTAGLDPEQSADMRRLIRRLGTERAVLVSSHALAEVEALCDRVVILHRGRVLSADTPARLAARLRPASRVDVEAAAPADALAAALAAVPGVRRVDLVTQANGHARCRVELEPGRDARAELAARVTGSGWGLLAP